MSDLQKKLINKATKKKKKRIKRKPKYFINNNPQTKTYIKQSLKGYIEIALNELDRDLFVRYISIKNGRLRLTNGGYIVSINNEYIKFKRNRFYWVIPKKYYNAKDELVFTTRFFRKIDRPDFLEKRVDKIEKVIAILIKNTKKVEKELNNLKRDLQEDSYSDSSTE